MVDITVTSVTRRVQVSHHINLHSCHRLGTFIIVSEASTIYIQNATGQLYKIIDRRGGFLTVEENNNLKYMYYRPKKVQLSKEQIVADVFPKNIVNECH